MALRLIEQTIGVSPRMRSVTLMMILDRVGRKS